MAGRGSSGSEKGMKEKKCPLFYGWLVVIACFLVMGVSVGVVNNSNGAYVKPVCADMGFSRGPWP